MVFLHWNITSTLSYCTLLLQLSSPVSVFMCVVFFSAPIAVERNNLMRLSQSIPFTPVPPRGKSGSGSDMSAQVKTPQTVLRNNSRQFENEEVRRQIRDVVSALLLPSRTCSCLLHSHAQAIDEWSIGAGTCPCWRGAADFNDLLLLWMSWSVNPFESGSFSAFHHGGVRRWLHCILATSASYSYSMS